MRFGSLFAGIGGLDLGLERAGMECAWQVEIDKYCQGILENHWPDVPKLGDIKDVGKNNLEPVDLIAGGFPCQDVSVAGKRAGFDGGRSSLWFEFARIIESIKPKWVVIENVPGLFTSNGGRDFAAILQGLGKLGYSVGWRVYDAQYFGVPQRRRRIYIIGCNRKDDFKRFIFEQAKYSGYFKETETKGNQDTRQNDEYYDVSWWNGDLISQTLDAVLYKKQAMPEKNRFPAVLVPAWVECESCDDYWCNIHGEHAYDCSCPEVEAWTEAGLWPYSISAIRYISPLESERIMGFPDNWTEGNSNTQRYKQLGNAVVPQVAEHIGRMIMEMARDPA